MSPVRAICPTHFILICFSILIKYLVNVTSGNTRQQMQVTTTQYYSKTDLCYGSKNVTKLRDASKREPAQMRLLRSQIIFCEKHKL